MPRSRMNDVEARLGLPRSTRGERLADLTGWLVAGAGMVLWVATDRWPVGLGAIAFLVVVLAVTATRAENRQKAAFLAEPDEPAEGDEDDEDDDEDAEARRAAWPAYVEERAGLSIEAATRWLEAAPAIDLPAGLGTVEHAGHRYDVRRTGDVAITLGTGIAFPEGRSWYVVPEPFPPGHADAVARTYPKDATASVFRTPAGDVALRWSDEQP